MAEFEVDVTFHVTASDEEDAYAKVDGYLNDLYTLARITPFPEGIHGYELLAGAATEVGQPTEEDST